MEPSCDICKILGPIVRCVICELSFCTSQCMSISPDPQTTEQFECPDCLGDNDLRCPNATRNFPAPQVAVLTICLSYLTVAGANLSDVICGSLVSAGIEVHSLNTTILEAVNNSWTISKWLSELSPLGSLFVLVITETTMPDGWIYCETEEGMPCDETEVQFLDHLFITDDKVRRCIHNFRQSSLFMLSCGGNYRTMDSRPDFKNWMNNDVFKNMICFLNPRLSMSQLSGFLSRFVRLVCVSAKPVCIAIVEAYTRDEQTRAHTDIVWFTVSGILVFRYAPEKSRPVGIDLPSVDSICRCTQKTPKIKRWIFGTEHQDGEKRIMPYHTSCCKRRLRLVFPHGHAEPLKNAGVTFIKSRWPALSEYYFCVGDAP